MRMTQNIRGLHHVGLPSRSPTDTIAFFQKLDFGKIYMNHVVYLQRGELTLEVYPVQDAAPRCRCGHFQALGITVTDLQESARRVGFAPEITSQMLPTGQVLHTVTGTGPDGMAVRLVQPGDGSFPTCCDYVEAPVTDLNHATAYFEELCFDPLFFVQERLDGEIHDTVYLQMGDWMIKLVQQDDAPPAASYIDHIALEVQDIEAAYNTATAFSCHLLEDAPRYLPIWQHGTRFFTMQGPEGQKIEFCEVISH